MYVQRTISYLTTFFVVLSVTVSTTLHNLVAEGDLLNKTSPLSSPYYNCTSSTLPRQAMYSVNVVQRDAVPDGAALISRINGSSDFNFSFNTAWFPPPAGSNVADGLIVRVVECSPNHHPCPDAIHPEWSNAGALTIISANLSGPVPTASHVSTNSVQWAGTNPPPPSNRSEWGAADPRLTYRPKDETFYLTWDNCTQNCYPHRQTLLSTSMNPFDPSGWTLHGPVLPGKYTGGASLLFRDDAGGPPHFAFVSDSNTAGTLMLAESHDGVIWTMSSNASHKTFMTGRDGCWDKAGVAAGPQPERLSNGDYLYIYNVDTGFPYHPNPIGRCAIGWAILDKDDPTRIVARADAPLMTATLPWEQCPHKGYSCQETMVVFSTGMKPLGNDEFYIIYGGADTDVGITKIKVDIRNGR